MSVLLKDAEHRKTGTRVGLWAQHKARLIECQVPGPGL